MTRAEELVAAIAAFRAMSLCLNPDCETGDRVIPWLDGVYCCHKCRVAHIPRSEREPDLTCARKACPVVPDETVRNVFGGYCSKTCIALDTPSPVEAWAAAMGRAIDGMPVEAGHTYTVSATWGGRSEPDRPDLPSAVTVAGLDPAQAGAGTPGPPSEAQGDDRRADAFGPIKLAVDEAIGMVRAIQLAGSSVAVSGPHDAKPRLRWWARLLRRTA